MTLGFFDEAEFFDKSVSAFSKSRSEWDVVVLLPGIFQFLVAEEGERAGDAFASGVRSDHLVDIAALGGDEAHRSDLHIGAQRDLCGIADVPTGK